MSDGFSDRLDATLAQLKAQGVEIVRILASAEAMERIFRERGEAAILLDCDPKRDIGWYMSEFEIEAQAAPGASVMYRQDGRTLHAVIEGDEPPTDDVEARADLHHRAAA
jgi:hypothetical protein